MICMSLGIKVFVLVDIHNMCVVFLFVSMCRPSCKIECKQVMETAQACVLKQRSFDTGAEGVFAMPFFKGNALRGDHSGR